MSEYYSGMRSLIRFLSLQQGRSWKPVNVVGALFIYSSCLVSKNGVDQCRKNIAGMFDADTTASFYLCKALQNVFVKSLLIGRFLNADGRILREILFIKRNDCIDF